MNQDLRLSRLVVSRRRALALGGTLSLGGLLAACDGSEQSTASSRGSTSASTSASASARAVPTTASVTDVVALLDKAKTCTMTQEETQGPYWFDVDSIRSDIREGRPGTVLNLALRVQDVSACSTGAGAAPVANSVVEIWHCDAGGIYAGFETGSRGVAGGAPGGGPQGSGETSNGSYSVGDSEGATTDDATYMRGAQVADSNGIVQFTTIYPGWYPGRTVHIHLKVHRDKTTVLTTQLFMDEGVNAEVFATSPYSDHTGRDVFNDDDNIYDDTSLLAISQELRAGRERRVALQGNSQQSAVNVSQVSGADQRFLAEKAALREADRLGSAPDLHAKCILIDILPVEWRPRFDTQTFVGRRKGKHGPCCLELLADLVLVGNGKDEIETRKTKRFVPAQLAAAPCQIHHAVLQGPKTRHRPRKLFEHGLRLWAV